VEQREVREREPKTSGTTASAASAEWPSLEVLAYQYFNWRKNTGQDILLLLGFTMLTVILLGLGNLMLSISEGVVEGSPQALLASTYNIAQLWYSEGFPEQGESSWVRELYAVMVASIGLVFFTVLLAMVEQRFLEVLEDNVARGSNVYDDGHMVVLAWVESALSMNTVWKVLAELCEAHKPDGGTRVVVLSNKPKLEMERQFAEFIPVSHRFGTSFVFREGSPLIPRNLRTVAATRARSTIIISDHTRAALEADAQALRAAVLLDEMFGSSTARGNIIVEMQTRDAAQLVRSSCSQFVLPVPTYSMNSLRLAKLVQRPISVVATSKMLNFPSSQLHFHRFPELTGTAFKNLKYFFPNATVLGLLDRDNGLIMWNPLDAELGAEHVVLLLRPTDCQHGQYRPLPAPAVVDLSSSFEEPTVPGSTEQLFFLESPSEVMARGISSVSKHLSRMINKAGENLTGGSRDDELSPASSQDEESQGFGIGKSDSASLDLLMPELSSSKDSLGLSSSGEGTDLVGEEVERLAKLRVLIIGWAEDSLMMDTIRELDRGLAALPAGTQVTLFNDHFPGFGTPGSDANPQNAGLSAMMARLERISLYYNQGCPLDPTDICRLPINSFDCIIILCDQAWLDPDMDPANGIDARQPEDMQRIDSMMTMVAVAVRSQISAGRSVGGTRTNLVVTEKVLHRE